MELKVFPNHFVMKGPIEPLMARREAYSFRDKSVEYQLARHVKSVHWSSMSGSWVDKFDTREDFDLWIVEHQALLKSRLDVYCCDWLPDQSLRVPIGLLPIVKKLFGKEISGFDDLRDFDCKPYRRLRGLMSKLRDPQARAMEAIKDCDGMGLIRMATGVGKTVIGQEIIREYGMESIFLVPSAPILRQTVARFQRAFGKTNVGIFGDGSKRHGFVTVATYQSVNLAKDADFEALQKKKLIIGDEIHHVGADTFYHAVENVLSGALYRYGLTADEERADGGTMLIEAAIGPLLYSYDVQEAIRDGYLAKPTFQVYQVYTTQGTYTKWKTTKTDRVAVGIEQSEGYTGSDSHKAYKNWVLGNDRLNDKVCELAKGFVNAGMSVLILVDEREHGDKLMRSFQDIAQFAVGGQDNSGIQKSFNARELKLVVATSTFSEGTDTIPVDVLINLMLGKRPKQANGRALRNDQHPETGEIRKPTTLIIDFDFPNCEPLNRDYKMRVQVHQTCGDVHVSRLV